MHESGHQLELSLWLPLDKCSTGNTAWGATGTWTRRITWSGTWTLRQWIKANLEILRGPPASRMAERLQKLGLQVNYQRTQEILGKTWDTQVGTVHWWWSSDKDWDKDKDLDTWGSTGARNVLIESNALGLVGLYSIQILLGETVATWQRGWAWCWYGIQHWETVEDNKRAVCLAVSFQN